MFQIKVVIFKKSIEDLFVSPNNLTKDLMPKIRVLQIIFKKHEFFGS